MELWNLELSYLFTWVWFTMKDRYPNQQFHKHICWKSRYFAPTEVDAHAIIAIWVYNIIKPKVIMDCKLIYEPLWYSSQLNGIQIHIKNKQKTWNAQNGISWVNKKRDISMIPYFMWQVLFCQLIAYLQIHQAMFEFGYLLFPNKTESSPTKKGESSYFYLECLKKHVGNSIQLNPCR